MSIKDHVIIITGASSGIGEATAVKLAKNGAKVVLTARREERLEQLKEKIEKDGGSALVVTGDVTSRDDFAKVVSEAKKVYGTVNGIINNAGLAVVALFREYPGLNLFRHAMDVNFYGAVHCTYYALPHLIHSRGRIAAVSSLGGKAPLPYNSPYIASKFAMHDPTCQ